MSVYNGLLNLTNWIGNVIMPVLAGLFIVVAIVNFSRGRGYSHQMYGALLCLLVSGLLRAMETFAGQRTWNDPDVYGVAIQTFVNWAANVLLPVYAAVQVAPCAVAVVPFLFRRG